MESRLCVKNNYEMQTFGPLKNNYTAEGISATTIFPKISDFLSFLLLHDWKSLSFSCVFEIYKNLILILQQHYENRFREGKIVRSRECALICWLHRWWLEQKTDAVFCFTASQNICASQSFENFATGQIFFYTALHDNCHLTAN